MRDDLAKGNDRFGDIVECRNLISSPAGMNAKQGRHSIRAAAFVNR
jgi:hypothetical protein